VGEIALQFWSIREEVEFIKNGKEHNVKWFVVE